MTRHSLSMCKAQRPPQHPRSSFPPQTKGFGCFRLERGRRNHLYNEASPSRRNQHAFLFLSNTSKGGRLSIIKVLQSRPWARIISIPGHPQAIGVNDADAALTCLLYCHFIAVKASRVAWTCTPSRSLSWSWSAELPPPQSGLPHVRTLLQPQHHKAKARPVAASFACPASAVRWSPS